MICFAVLITSVTLVLYFTSPVDNSQSEKSGQIVALNEIDQLVKAGDNEEASLKISDLQDKIKSADNEKRGNGRILIIGGTGLALILLGWLSEIFHNSVFEYHRGPEQSRDFFRGLP